MTSPKNKSPNYMKPKISLPLSPTNNTTPIRKNMKPKLTTTPGGIRKSMIRNELPTNRQMEHGSESESNIRVYVRCRGRNPREIRENSSVVISTPGGIKNKDISVQTGTSTYTNKSYSFDRVFGPEADQEMVYDEVANKSLNEMLQGFNCTIFAYGQTGTGKTYTMSGDNDGLNMNNSRPDEKSGIIPRILFNLFKSLAVQSKGRKVEHSVKLSYIELYNEELRDLISVEGEDDKKVKIYDDSSKKGVVIHGMEEAFVKNIDEAMEVLKIGSVKRQVASTSCNDQSSRSHSVFTITVHIKEISDLTGQEFVKIGKLNLVDLAGSENINRSGAENKRARETGMINQSLLTLGRVINALVDRSAHIPYRESKLTRILQDSLGGRTKTCIIATVSPAKVSLDETISTLEYASRAKSIKNKPQQNQTMSKQTHIIEYVMEIERLKQDLQSTRQKNGVYLSTESHQLLVDQNESRRIQIDEQKLRLDVVEHQLREAKEKSDQYDEIVANLQKELNEKNIQYNELHNRYEVSQNDLFNTKIQLNDEIKLRQEYEITETKLHAIGNELLLKLTSTIEDVNELQTKLSTTIELNQSNEVIINNAKKHIYNVIGGIESDASQFRNSFASHNQILHEKTGELIESMSSNLSSVLQSIQSTTISSQESHGNILHAMIECENDTSKVISEISQLKEQLLSSISSQFNSLENILTDHLETVLGSVRNQYNHSKKFFEDTGEQFTTLAMLQNERTNNQRLQVDEIIRALGKLTNDITNVLSKYNDQQTTRLEVEISSANKEQELLVSHVQTMFQDLTQKINILSDERRNRLNENYNLSKTQLMKISTDLSDSAGNIISNHVTPLLDSQKESSHSFIEDNEKIKESMKEASESNKAFAHLIYRQTKETKSTINTDIKSNINKVQDSITVLDPFQEKLSQINHKGYESIEKLIELSSNEINQSLTSTESNISQIETKILDSSEELANELENHSTLYEAHQQTQHEQLTSLKEYTTDSIQLQLNQTTGSTPPRKTYTYPNKLPKTLPPPRDTEHREALIDININSI